jgi:hypothetical protein
MKRTTKIGARDKVRQALTAVVVTAGLAAACAGDPSNAPGRAIAR